MRSMENITSQKKTHTEKEKKTITTLLKYSLLLRSFINTKTEGEKNSSRRITFI